jgi:hypothetical protein
MGQPLSWQVGFFLSDLWRGRRSLGKAFWGYLLLGTFGAMILGMLAGLPLLWLGNLPAARLVSLSVFFGYEIVASVGVWRSANAIIKVRAERGQKLTYSEAAKIIGAKLFVVLWMLGHIVRITGKPLDTLVGDLLRLMHLI